MKHSLSPVHYRMEPNPSPIHSSVPPSCSDEALFEALKRRESSALSHLFHRHGRLVYNLALKILANPQEAEDLTQEIFLTLWRNAVQNPECRYFVRYLVTMTKSRAIDKIRSRSRYHTLVQRWEITMNVDTHCSLTPDEHVLRTDRAEKIRHAMTQLPERQRIVLEMAYDQGFSQSDIARRLEIPLGTVKTSTRQGLLKLKQILLASDGLTYE